MCEDNLLLSKLLYLCGIYYNVIGQDPSHDNLFNYSNILKKKCQKIFFTFGDHVGECNFIIMNFLRN